MGVDQHAAGQKRSHRALERLPALAQTDAPPLPRHCEARLTTPLALFARVELRRVVSRLADDLTAVGNGYLRLRSTAQARA